MALRKRRHQGRKPGALGIEKNPFFPFLMDYLEAQKLNGVSPDTLRRRLFAMRRFIVWCQEGNLTHPRDITRQILDRYKAYLYYYRKQDGSALKQSSQNVMLTPIKSFFRWMARENHLLYSPASEWEIPKKRHLLPTTIMPYETVESVLALPDVTTPQGIRDRAILEVFYSTGIRRFELCVLEMAKVDTKNLSVNIREGKGLRSRIIPIGERAAKWVEKYKQKVRPLLLSPLAGDTLFLTDFGEPFGRAYMGALIRRYLNEEEVEARGACHLFRHAMATHMHDNGADIRNIQVMLGHVDLSSTQIYTRVSIAKLRQVHSATHPVERGQARLA
jgi:integrase/recombinase XerD